MTDQFTKVLIFRPFGAVLAAILIAAAAPGQKEQERAAPPELVREIPLPAELASAADLRFDSDNEILVSAGKAGVYRYDISKQATKPPELLIQSSKDGGPIWMPWDLAISPGFIAASSPAFQLHWREYPFGSATGEVEIEFIEDIDLYKDKLAILGLRKHETGMALDGAIAWVAQLGKKEPELRPVAYAAAGARARPFDLCATFELGTVRFLDDGRLVVVPGAEPGAFLYSEDLELVRAWDTTSLGIGAKCEFDEKTRAHLAIDEPARWAWVNKFETVDEILDTKVGPTLITRAVTSEGTRWRLVILSDDGSLKTVPLPIKSKSPMAHLHGDVREDRILLVYFEWDPKFIRRNPTLYELRFPSSDSDEEVVKE